MQRSKLFSVLLVALLLVTSVTFLLPASAQENTAQRNKNAVREALAQASAGNIDAFLQLYAEQFQMNQGDATLYDTTPAEITPFITGLAAAIPDLQIVPEVLIAQGEWVAAQLTISGTFSQPFEFFGLQPTNQPVRWTEMDFFRFNEDGKIVENWAASDPMIMLTQMGVMPPSEEDENAETPLESPVGYQLLSADELAASYTSENMERSLAQFQNFLALGRGIDTTSFYADPHISWENGAPFEVTAEEAMGNALFLQTITTAMPDITATPIVVVAEGDWVAGLVTINGTSSVEVSLEDMALPPTGLSMVWLLGIIDRYDDDGLIVEEWVESDASPMLTALGLMPPMSEGE